MRWSDMPGITESKRRLEPLTPSLRPCSSGLEGGNQVLWGAWKRKSFLVDRCPHLSARGGSASGRNPLPRRERKPKAGPSPLSPGGERARVRGKAPRPGLSCPSVLHFVLRLSVEGRPQGRRQDESFDFLRLRSGRVASFGTSGQAGQVAHHKSKLG